MNQTQIKAYLTPGHPTYMSGVAQIQRSYPSLTKRAIRQFLSNIDAYTLHRETKRPRKYNPIYVRKKNVLWQADLADLSALASKNNKTRYLLTVLDTFSRRAWALPIKEKTGVEVWRAFRRILGKRRPKKLLTDRGTEFTNSIFRQGLKRLNITSVHLHSDQKAAHVERFNRTLKRLIYNYLTHSASKRYLDVLPQLMSTYNNRYHRIIKMSPFQADQEKNRKRVLANLAPLYHQDKKNPSYTVGTLVRVKRAKRYFQRGHDESFSRHIYRIARINTVKPRPTYFISTLDNDDEFEGGFYEEELQPVQFNDVFKKDKILQETTGEVLVSWKGWGPEYNAWIDKNYLPLLAEK